MKSKNSGPNSPEKDMKATVTGSNTSGFNAIGRKSILMALFGGEMVTFCKKHIDTK